VIRALRTPRGAAAAVVLLVLVSAVLRGWAAWLVPAPWLSGDETIYSLLGQGLYREGKLAILGGPTGFFSLVWPAIAGLPLSLGDLGLGYRILRVFEPLLMSLAAIPAYLWARRAGAGSWALVAAALTLALPALGYSSFVMTEVVYYPLVTLALLAAAAVLERPTARRQALFAVALVLAVLTRVQAIVLVPVVVTALVLEALLAREPRRALRLLPALAGLTLLGVAYIAWKVAAGGSATGVLGAYSETAHGYRVGTALKFIVYHLADALLLVAVAPACAVALLLVGAVRRREPDDAVRAYLALAASLFGWLVLQVGLFASQFGDRLQERYLIALAPVLFVGLALWLARGGPRPRFATAWICLAAVVLVEVVPYKRLVTRQALVDSFGLAPLWAHVQPSHYALTLGLAAAASVALLALLPRRALFVLPTALLVTLVYASVSSSRHALEEARLTQQRLLGPDPRWIDRAAHDGTAGFLYDGDVFWTAVWENLFFNRRLRHVYNLPGEFVPGPLPEDGIKLDGTGLLRLHPDDRYLVTWDSLQPDGEAVARAPLVGANHAALVLWRLRRPARLLARQEGLLPNGDIYAGVPARLTAFGCDRSGSFILTMIGKQDEDVGIAVNGRPSTSVHLTPGQVWSNAIPAPPTADGRHACTFDVSSSGLLGTTQFEFRR
jgi:hypothetical protein